MAEVEEEDAMEYITRLSVKKLATGNGKANETGMPGLVHSENHCKERLADS
jgi:hypothetical protein